MADKVHEQPGRAEYEAALGKLRYAVMIASMELSEHDRLSRDNLERLAVTFDEFFFPASRFVTFGERSTHE